MSVILVVEQDTAYAHRIKSVLGTAGYASEVSADAEEAAAQSGDPRLVLASGTLPGASQLLGRFSTGSGGPGSVVILPVSIAGQTAPGQYQADRVLPKPFSDEELLNIVGHFVPRPSNGPGAAGQLTSAEIFGDVLAEVEAEAQVTESRRRRPRSDHSDIDRKLEETLSGFFPDKLKGAAEESKSAPPKAKRRRDVPSADEIEDLLDKTLSSLELPSRSRRPKTGVPQAQPQPSAPAPSPSAPSASAPSAPAPSAPAPSAPAPSPSAPASSAPASSPSAPSAQGPAPAAVSPTVPAPTPPAAAAPPAAVPPAEAPAAAEPLADAAPSRRPAGPSPMLPPLPPLPVGPPSPSPSASPAPDAAPSKGPGASFETPGSETPTPAPSAPSVDPPPSFDAPALDAPPPSFDSPPPSPSFESPFEPAASSPKPSRTPTAFSLGDEPPLASPDHPSSFASFDEPQSPPPSAPPPDPFAAAPPAPVEPPAEEPPAVIEPPSLPEPSAPPPLFGEAPPTEAPSEPVGSPAFEPPQEAAAPEEAAQPAFDDSFGSLSADLYSTDSFAVDSFTPTYEPAEEPAALPASPPPEPDPFAASRHGEAHPTDFASAFSMPEPTQGGAAAGEDSTDRLQEALDGVLQIRGEREAVPPVEDHEGTPFGDYRLLERIAVGGMAEVWRARRRGVEGFQKTVAIKKILSHLTGSSDFVTMFIDEAKLAAQLNHANIIQIYDLGKVDDDFFIAMEMVDGKDLRSILNRAAELDRPLPPGLALTIVAALARALDYAHRKRDFDNRDLGLVHRDVSPQNVLISYEGEIKLCDFGIVKAVAKASTTQMGALKGKLQYMSPEQAWGKEVDARSDIFSLGSVLFEVLTGERLFTGDSEIGVLDAVRDCRVRGPRSIEPDLPAEIDRIALKALAKTPEERYQTAGELEKDILSALETLKPSPGQGDLAAYLDSLFQRSGSPAQAPAPTEGTDPVLVPSAEAESDPSSAPADASKARSDARPEPSKSKAKLFLILAILLAALATIGFILYQTFGSGASPSPATDTPSQTPAATAPPVPAATAPGDETDPAAGTESTESEEPAEGSDTPKADAVDMEGMVDAALASERERIEADFEARRKRLEEELKKTQGSETQEGGSGGGSSPGN